MYRIDNSTASVAMPAIGAVGPNVDAFFNDGDPTTATPSTILPADWLNSFQEELCNLVESAGVTLVKGELEQLRLAIDYLAQKNEAIYSTSSSSPNSYTTTLDPAPVEYTEGMAMLIKFTNANTSSVVTINVNTLGAKNIKRYDGTTLAIGDIADGCIAHLMYDGTNFLMLNTVLSLFNNYAPSVSPANTYTATLSTVPAAYTAGQFVLIKFTHKNTGAATINLNGLGAISIVRKNGTALKGGEIADGMIAHLVYDGTNFQLSNAHSVTPTLTNLTSGSGTYTVGAGINYIRVRGWGGGGGGVGSWVSPTVGTSGGDGGDTTFGSYTGKGGKGAPFGGQGGLGGIATGSGITRDGQNGNSGLGNSGKGTVGGQGGNSALINGAGVHYHGGSFAGQAGKTNSGGGGSGGGTDAGVLNSSSGGGGGGSSSFEVIIEVTPGDTFSYAIGAGGTAGSAGASGFIGGVGAAGKIEIEEHYQ